MIIPIRTDSPLRSTPYMNWALIIANVVMFGLQGPLHLPERLALNPHDPHWWSYFSYAFMHDGVLHIFGNMLFLYIFGNNVCDKMGGLAYLGFYLAGAVFSGAGYAIGANAGVVGASGAVSAITGAYLVLFPRSHITLAYLLFFFGVIEVPSFYLIIFFFLKDLLFGLASTGDVAGGGVAYMAHVAGTVYGFIVCLLLLWVRLLPRDQFDIVALIDRWNRRRQYRDVVASGYNPFDYVNHGKASRPPPVPTAKEREISELRAAISTAIATHDLDSAGRMYLQMKAMDPNQVLPRQAQLDIANNLAGKQLYAQAAEAYEQFLKAYPKFEQVEQVQLMLGLIYARYLQQWAPAREHLLRALARLQGSREIDMAKGELTRIEMMMAGLG